MFIKLAILLLFISCNITSCDSQTSQPTGSMSGIAGAFLSSLSAEQKARAQFAFDDDERYNWHFIPKDRKGIPLGELQENQRKAAMELLKTGLSDNGYSKATAIIELENVLKVVEGRDSKDGYRDPGKYFFSVFGNPLVDSIWGWRLEGHHVSFNFSTKNNSLVSATPGFLGANPAIVLSGPEKGKQVLKDETELGFALLQSLDVKQKTKAIIDVNAPGEIITGASRKAMISHPGGIPYNELNDGQQKKFMQLLSVYIHRYTRLFASQMMDEIEKAGLDNLRFTWAGAVVAGPGQAHYYRIQGPTIIIEYDNTQNNANHVHTVLRDLKNDFGSDELLEHYKSSHHK